MQNNPSVSFADSSPYTREPLTQEHSSLVFICFLLIGIAYMERRHYGGVFIIQKDRRLITDGGFLLCSLQNYSSTKIGNSIYDLSRKTVFFAIFEVVCVENAPF